MAASLELQRASIKKQTGDANRASSFFTIPWLEPIHGSNPEPACEPLPEAEVAPLVREAARANQLQPELIRAVMRQESGFRPCAISEKGALGLMQLMPATVEQFAVRDPFDAKENVSAGARLLRQLLTQFKGDLRLALSAYNAGAGSIKSGGIPDIPETQAYVRSIMESLPKDMKDPGQIPPANR